MRAEAGGYQARCRAFKRGAGDLARGGFYEQRTVTMGEEAVGETQSAETPQALGRRLQPGPLPEGDELGRRVGWARPGLGRATPGLSSGSFAGLHVMW